MRNYKVESIFEHEGLKCVVIMGSMGYRCGYVGIPNKHPLYGLDYSDESEYLIASNMNDNISIDNLGIGQLLGILSGEYKKDKISPEMFFDVHGGITYANGGKNSNYPIESDLWWFGYDCGHAGDSKDLSVVDERIREIEMRYPVYGVLRTKEYCENECKKLADQLSKII